MEMSKRTARLLSAPLAIMLALFCLTAAPGAKAAIADGGGVYLLDSGASSLNATTDWRVYVEKPSYVSLDQDYWNFTVYAQMVNNTGTAAGKTFTTTIYLYDGVINRSASSSIAAVVTSTGPQYGNISFPAATLGLFQQNQSAHIYITLTVSASIVDHYGDDIAISTSGLTGVFNDIIPLVVIMILFAMVIKVMGKAGKGILKR